MPTEPIQTADHTATLPQNGTLAQSPDEQAHAAASSSYGVVIPGYEIECELGRGGMGVVYRARQGGLKRLVALKMLIAGVYTDPSTRARFLLEAESVAALEHPNIVKVFAFGEHNGHPFLAMELLSSGNLTDRVKAHGAIPPLEATTLVAKLAAAVAHAHSRGVVHRDIKPGNVLLTSDGDPRLTDFGLAKVGRSDLSVTGQVLGTPAYMAPEQAAGKVHEVGTPADVYALGAVLYDLLTGRPPFMGHSAAATIQLVLTTDPDHLRKHNADVPRDLETICLKCLQKDPAKRYATAQAVAEDLNHFLKGEPITARPTGVLERTVKWVRRNKGRAAAVMGAMLIPIAAVGFYFYDLEQKNQARYEHENHELRLAQQSELQLQQQAEIEARSMEQLQTRSRESLRTLDVIRDMIVRGKLRNVGGLDPLRDVLFEHYKQRNDELKREGNYDKQALARSWIEFGKMIAETGRKDLASEAFSRAIELFNTAPDSPESRLNRAQAQAMFSRVAFELNRPKEAMDSCDTIEALLAGADENKLYARELGEMWHLRGELFQLERQIEKAVHAYDKAVTFRLKALGGDMNLPVERFIELAKEDPARFKTDVEILRGLARDYAYQAGLWLLSNDVAKADKAYGDAHSIRERVRKMVRGVAFTSDEYLTDLALAESHYSRGPLNYAWVMTYCRALTVAKMFAQDSLELRRKVCDANPNILEFRRDVCTTLNVVVDLKLMLGEYDPDIAVLLDDSLKVPKDLSESEGSYSVEALGILATGHLLRAQYYGYKSDPDVERAKTERKLATTYLDELLKKNPSEPVAMFNSALALAMRADLITQTGVNIDQLKVAFQTDSLNALERAIKLGYRDKHPDDIREMRHFEKLKNNPRFEELLGKLRAAREPVKAVKTPAPSP